MRKNTEACLKAFTLGYDYRADRDVITVKDTSEGSYVVTWELHGNEIASREHGSLTLSTCHWNTMTTWERLNAVSRFYGVSFSRAESMKYWPRNLQSMKFWI